MESVGCQFKLGELAPACAKPATTIRHLSLPEWVADGVRIAPDQRELDLDVCDDHAAFMDELMAFRQKPVPASARADLPIPSEHAGHTAYVPGCLGCGFDFEPPW